MPITDITMKCPKRGKTEAAVSLFKNHEKKAWCCPECGEPLVPFRGDEGEETSAPC